MTPDQLPDNRDLQRFISTQELALLTDLSVKTIERRRRLREDVPPATRFGRKWAYWLPSVLEWIDAHRFRLTSEDDSAG